MKILDIIIISLIMFWTIFSIIIIIKNRKKDKKGCSGNCSVCPKNCKYK